VSTGRRQLATVEANAASTLPLSSEVLLVWWEDAIDTP